MKNKRRKDLIMWTIVDVLLFLSIIIVVLFIIKQIKTNEENQQTDGIPSPSPTTSVVTGAAQSPTEAAVSTTAPIDPTPTSGSELSPSPTNTPSPTSIPSPSPTPSPSPSPTPSPTPTPVPEPTRTEDEYASLDNTTYGWSFQRMSDHSQSGNWGYADKYHFAEIGAYYLNPSVTDDDKVLYFAFDCGYEYGYTPKILDVMKEKDVKGIFFVTQDFLRTDPELAKRMKDEGHLVGNHTVTHPSLPDKSTAQVKAEILDCAAYFKEVTGYEMDPYIRPPMGEFSARTLQITKDLGYKTILWSIAYLDYDVNDQPGKDYVVNHFKKYYHNGAITLTHTVSSSNTEALGEVIDFLRAEGYRFGTLDELQ